MKALLMILIFFPGVLSAQVELDLQLCREMAIRNSKEMEIADRQHRKAMFDTKSYRADYLPKLSAVGVGFYNQKGFRRNKTALLLQAHEMPDEIKKGFCLPRGYRFSDESLKVQKTP